MELILPLEVWKGFQNLVLGGGRGEYIRGRGSFYGDWFKISRDWVATDLGLELSLLGWGIWSDEGSDWGG